MMHANLEADLQADVPHEQRRSRRRRLGLYAAILLLAIVPAGIYGMGMWVKTGTAIVDAVNAANPRPVEVPGVRFQAYGNGRVMQATDAAALPRDVALTGRAFFDVAPHAMGPLRIVTHAAVITSNGARFTAWGAEGEPTLVGVIEGNVEVTGRDTQGNPVGEPVVFRTGSSVRVVRGEPPTLLDP